MPSPAPVPAAPVPAAPVPAATRAGAAPPAPSSATPAFRRWAIAVTVYITAVFNRTSLGVAGLQAASRLGITPAQLSVFVLVQLGVYAAMQVPTGLLVDRYGPRRLLVAAAVTMALAQLAFALTRSYPVALLARGVLGCGDALTFVSVVRVAAQDFPRRRFPLAVSVTSMLGMAGNLAATIPLTLLLRSAGWTLSFAGTGLVSLLTGVAVWVAAARGPARRCAAAHGAAARGAAAHGRGRADAAPGARGLAHPGHPAGLLGALLLHVAGHHVRGAVGPALPGPAGLHRSRGERRAAGLRAGRHRGQPGHRRGLRPLPGRPGAVRARRLPGHAWPAGRCCSAASAGGRRTR